MESPPCSSAGTGTFLAQTTSSSFTSTHQHSSSTLPHQSSSHPHTSPHYSTSSLPHKHTSLSFSQQSSPSILRSSRTRTSCTPLTPAPTAPLPVCPSSVTGIRYVSPSSHKPYAHLQAQSVRWEYYLILKKKKKKTTSKKEVKGSKWYIKWRLHKKIKNNNCCTGMMLSCLCSY